MQGIIWAAECRIDGNVNRQDCYIHSVSFTIRENRAICRELLSKNTKEMFKETVHPITYSLLNLIIYSRKSDFLSLKPWDFDCRHGFPKNTSEWWPKPSESRSDQMHNKSRPYASWVIFQVLSMHMFTLCEEKTKIYRWPSSPSLQFTLWFSHRMTSQDLNVAHESYLCLSDEIKSYGFGTTWGWENDDRIFVFGRTIPQRIKISRFPLILKYMR